MFPGVFFRVTDTKERRASDGRPLEKIFNIYDVFSLGLLLFHQSQTKLVLDEET